MSDSFFCWVAEDCIILDSGLETTVFTTLFLISLSVFTTLFLISLYGYSFACQ